MCAVEIGRSHSRAGFTLLELLMVVVIIGILFGILLPVVTGLKQNAIVKQREVEARLIESAIYNYHAEKGEWPVSSSEMNQVNVAPGVIYSNNNATLIDLLCGNVPPLLDTNNMAKANISGKDCYLKPGTTNSPWMIVISNRTVTVQ